MIEKEIKKHMENLAEMESFFEENLKKYPEFEDMRIESDCIWCQLREILRKKNLFCTKCKTKQNSKTIYYHLDEEGYCPNCGNIGINIGLQKIVDECFNLYKESIQTPEQALEYLITPFNYDLGGVLSIILCGKPDISTIDYEIIKLKIYNKFMESFK